ncbi:MAG: nucleotide-binding protein [Cyclobacteriaceae bacterium]
MPNRIPVFIGSSSEGSEAARAVKMNLEQANDSFEIEVWDQGTFKTSEFILESLLDKLPKFAFTIFIVSADDLIHIREDDLVTTRDNVIFEIGLSMGVNGRKRTFIVSEQTDNLRIPSDLEGLVRATYRRPETTTWPAAMGNASYQIIQGIDSYEKKKKSNFQVQTTKVWIDELVKGALHVSCKALSTPIEFTNAGSRAFIFKTEGDELVCTHFWSQLPVREVTGFLKFKITEETKTKIVVVKAFVEQRVCGQEVEPLTEPLEELQGEVEEELKYVLAAPIVAPDGSIWGTIDIDTTTDSGMKLLKETLTENVLFELGKHVYLALNYNK